MRIGSYHSLGAIQKMRKKRKTSATVKGVQKPRVTKRELEIYTRGLDEEWFGEYAQEDRFWKIHTKMLKRPDLLRKVRI